MKAEGALQKGQDNEGGGEVEGLRLLIGSSSLL